MNDNQKIIKIIKEVCESKGLYASPAHMSGMVDDLYDIGVYGLDSSELFEFYWYEHETNISYTASIGLEDNHITDIEFNNIFKKEKDLFNNVTLRSKGNYVVIKGSFKKSSDIKDIVNEIIDYFNEPSDAIKELKKHK